jgi:hypothetical protein
MPFLKLTANTILKEYLFIAALLLYSTISSPFPKDIGIPELIVGLCIIFSIDYPYTFISYNQKGLFEKFNFVILFQIILLTLVLVPSITSIVNIVNTKFTLKGYSRDIIPLMYLFIPLFYFKLIFPFNFKWKYLLPWIISLNGSILSIRYFWVIYKENGLAPFLNIGHSSYGDSLLYLSYDSSVHYSSIFFLSYSAWMFFERKFLLSSITFLGGAISFLSNFIVAQRTPTFLTLIFVSIFLMVLLSKHLKKSIVFILLIIASIFLLAYIINPSEAFSIFDTNNFSIFSKLLEKQEKFGINAKDQELYTVIDLVFSSYFRTLFGIGWGTTFKDPIIPDEELSFTHSGVTYFLLKTGLVGLLFFISYIILVFKAFFGEHSRELRDLHRGPITNTKYDFLRDFKALVFFSSLSPIIIGLFFQVSYKTLSFGVVLLSLLLFY